MGGNGGSHASYRGYAAAERGGWVTWDSLGTSVGLWSRFVGVTRELTALSGGWEAQPPERKKAMAFPGKQKPTLHSLRGMLVQLELSPDCHLGGRDLTVIMCESCHVIIMTCYMIFGA